MGFSVSGAAAIVFLGLFISFGAFYTTAADGAERVVEARGDAEDAAMASDHTQINITSTSYDSLAGELTVRVNNTGETTLTISDTDLLVDGAYRTDDSSLSITTISGTTLSVDTSLTGSTPTATSSGTDLWRPGERLTYTVDTSTPSRVKVVTEYGVADSEVV